MPTTSPSAVNPKNGYAHHFVACAYWLQGNLAQALNAVNTAIKLIPSHDKLWNAYALRLRAKIHNKLDNADSALRDIDASIKLDPNNSDSFGKGTIFYKQEKYEFAQQCFLQMANIDEANPRAYFLLAQCYSLQGNFNNAITHINYALKLAPDNAYLLIHRALFHFFVSNYDDAIDDYIRATSIKTHTGHSNVDVSSNN